MQSNGQIIQQTQWTDFVTLTDSAVIFPIGDIPWQVQIVFNAPMSTVEA